MKPLTYMNLSGESIGPAADFFKAEASDVLVIYDDINLEPGLLRIRKKGSAGGHNGMKSIIAHLGDDTFPRIRVGIGGERHPDMDLADYVLGKIPQEEKTKIEECLDKVTKAAGLIVCDEIDEAMNLYSTGKKKGKKKKKAAKEAETKSTKEEPGKVAKETEIEKAKEETGKAAKETETKSTKEETGKAAGDA